jgi:TRAP-type C4-dicarboxylate transport system substrate-binding protein
MLRIALSLALLSLALLSLALLSLAAAPAVADEQMEITLAHGFRQNPFAVPIAAAAWKFKDVVESHSGNAIRVNIIPDGQAGDEDQIPRLVKSNVVQTAFLSAGPLIPHYSPIAVTLTPFVTASKAQASAIYDGPFGQRMAEDIRARTGMVVLGFAVEEGLHVITNSRRPVRSPADIKGLRLANIPGPGFTQSLILAMGGSVSTVSRLDVYSALDIGQIDGMLTSTEELLHRHYDEVQIFATITNHRHAPVVWLFNQEAYERLSAEQRNLLHQAAAEALASGRLVAARLDAELDSPRMLRRNLDVLTLSASDRDLFGQAVRRAIEASIAERYGDEGKDWFDRFVTAAASVGR